MVVPDNRQFEPELGRARAVALAIGRDRADHLTIFRCCPARRNVRGEVTVTLGTFNVDATQVGAAPVGAKPRLAAHWPCRLPATKSGPKVFVGAGAFPWHSRFPPTETRLMSEAALALLSWI
jgi:hypothetical protein